VDRSRINLASDESNVFTLKKFNGGKREENQILPLD